MTGWLDVHAHYTTRRYGEECEASGHGRPDGMPGVPGWSADQALALMEATGTVAAVLSVSSPGVHLGEDSTAGNRAARDLARHVNDAGAEVVTAHPARFGLSAVLPLPDVDGALVELERVYDELGADAVALETNYHGRYLSDPAVAPVLAELDARRAVVTLHPTSPPGWQRSALGRPRPMLEFLFDTTRCVVDLALSGTLARYPSIRWIVPHAGAVLPVVAERVSVMSFALADQWGGEPVDVSAALRSLYFDLAGWATPVPAAALLAVVPPDRLLYGSDFPFTPDFAVEDLARKVRDEPLLADARLDLVEGTAAGALFPRLLGAST